MSKKQPLRLYVWRNVWSDYTQGVAFALAHSPEEARALILDEMGYGRDYIGWIADQLDDGFETHDTPFGFGVMGGG